MKKLVLCSIGVVAAIIVLANLHSIIGFAIAAFIGYVGLYLYRKSKDRFGRFFWGAVIVLSIFAVLSNISAVIGIAAIIVILYIWKEWPNDEKKKSKVITHKQSEDPFVNFERQWHEIKQNS